ncbi:TonB-dependent receptor [Desulfosarcina ovata]|uniref:Uncharacterized protein n=1 Tax=Desulfosarcina ovata subsp. ovata TaxID=2752305 RepID=A0A5K8A9H3_9BACT|nr:TonB-dependent receptor [Desulfosarcina ovata]BBO89151.1 hypothetical protein DSCOOX_23310 [Desulfosarcina ovata subsp. ovata]
MSALYGSDAMAGVINIVTRKASEKRSFSGKIIGGMAENGDRETTIVRATGDLGAVGNTHHRLSTEFKKRGDYRLEDDQPYTSLKNDDMGDLSLHAYYRWIHDYYGSDPNLPRGSDPVNSNFDVVDVKLDYRFFDHHLISVGIDNLFDKETPANYTKGGSPLDPGERYYYVSYSINY